MKYTMLLMAVLCGLFGCSNEELKQSESPITMEHKLTIEEKQKWDELERDFTQVFGDKLVSCNAEGGTVVIHSSLGVALPSDDQDLIVTSKDGKKRSLFYAKAITNLANSILSDHDMTDNARVVIELGDLEDTTVVGYYDGSTVHWTE